MDSLEMEIMRGERAEQLLREPLLTEAFEIIEQEYMAQWKNSPARDEAGREKLWLMLKLLGQVHGQLQAVVNTGTFAKATLVQRAGQTLSSVFSR